MIQEQLFPVIQLFASVVKHFYQNAWKSSQMRIELVKMIKTRNTSGKEFAQIYVINV